MFDGGDGHGRRIGDSVGGIDRHMTKTEHEPKKVSAKSIFRFC